MPYKDLEDYGIIGNLETCALVGRDGSIDWLCLPYLESPSVFGALLDAEKGGEFAIAPAPPYSSRQEYIPCTNVLQTIFTAAGGRGTVTDFMGVKKEGLGMDHRLLVRRVECVEGDLAFHLRFKPRFDYARAIPEIAPISGGVSATLGAFSLFLQTDVEGVVSGAAYTASFCLRTREVRWFVLGYGGRTLLSADQCREMLEKVRQYWFDWAHTGRESQCLLEEPWQELVMRSDLVLKLLVNPDTGAIAAAATTSLPEEVGGIRNWDYRFAWLRDSAFTIQALFHQGHEEELQNFCGWLAEVTEKAQGMVDLRPLYGIHKLDKTDEEILPHLSGYRFSKPVRIGNGAAGQLQLDVYGELINAIYETTRYGDRFTERGWGMIEKILDHICGNWMKEDYGIWEARAEPRHYVHSKIMCWVALDRGIKLAEMTGSPYPQGKWESVREEIRGTILRHGFSAGRNSFVQAFGSEELDASVLQIGYLGFLPPDHPMVAGSIEAVMDGLTTKDGLVYRYTGDDGLPGKEGAFFLCSFWLVTALALAGRVEEAETIFEKVTRLIGPLGLLAEEVDPVSRRQLGNFPQAFSHIGIINSALYLGIAKGKGYRGPTPAGVDGEKRKPEYYLNP